MIPASEIRQLQARGQAIDDSYCRWSSWWKAAIEATKWSLFLWLAVAFLAWVWRGEFFATRLGVVMLWMQPVLLFLPALPAAICKRRTRELKELTRELEQRIERYEQERAQKQRGPG